MILPYLSHEIPGGAAFGSLLKARLPANAAEWVERFPAIALPTAMWPMQDLALPLVDTIGTFDLADVNANGAELVQQTGDPLGRKSVKFSEVDSGVALAAGADLDPGAGDFSILFRFRVDAVVAPGSSQYFFRKKEAGVSTQGWAVKFNSSAGDIEVNFTCFPVASAVEVAVSADHQDGAWHWCMAVIDRTAAEIRIYTDLGSGAASIAAFGGASIATANLFGIGDTPAVGNGCAVVEYSWASAWVGEALAQAEFDEVTAS